MNQQRGWHTVHIGPTAPCRLCLKRPRPIAANNTTPQELFYRCKCGHEFYATAPKRADKKGDTQ
jgi:hypothetical protein